jgi:hypothetical protein
MDRRVDDMRIESTVDYVKRSIENRPAGQCLDTLPTKDPHVTSSIS